MAAIIIIVITSKQNTLRATDWSALSCVSSRIRLCRPYYKLNVIGRSCKTYVWGSCPVWPDLAIYWTLGNFSKPVARFILPKLPTFLGNVCKGVKIFHFPVKSFLCNFYKHLATVYWSHCSCPKNIGYTYIVVSTSSNKPLLKMAPRLLSQIYWSSVTDFKAKLHQLIFKDLLWFIHTSHC